MNNDILAVHSILVSLVQEHLDESVSIDNSKAIEFYIGKLAETKSNVANKVLSGGEVPPHKIEEAMQTIHDMLYPTAINMAIRDYKTAQARS